MLSDRNVGEYVEKYLKDTLANISGDYIMKGVSEMVPLFQKARTEGRTVFFFGNGGSASTASHLVNDVAKLTIKEGASRFRCIALTDPVPTMMAWANDVSYADIFSEQLKNLGGKDDIAVGISGSGNSANVLKALAVARSMGMTTIGLIGTGGGKMKSLCDLPVIVPSSNMQHIEDVHLLIGHLLCSYLRDRT